MQTCNRCSGQEIDHCWLSSRSPPLPSAPFWWQYLRSYAALLFPLNWFKRNHTLWIILCLASFTQHYICFPSGWTNLMYIICDRNPVSFLSTWISSCLSTVRWKDNLFFTIFICHLVRNHWSYMCGSFLSLLLCSVFLFILALISFWAFIIWLFLAFDTSM